MKKLADNWGILAYGAAIPQKKILGKELAFGRGKDSSIPRSLGVISKTVPQLDEDAITLATDAVFQAIERLNDDKKKIEALFMGSESHPYAVKPSGGIIQTALGLSSEMAMADLQFACKAGSQSLQIAGQYVSTGQASLALAIGADTAQARPGDVLEFSAAAGAAAFIVGSDPEKILVKQIASLSTASDTPDFWRKPGEAYPQHAGRFTGKPAYFKHIIQTVKLLMERESLEVKDIDYLVLHSPNAKFPTQAAAILGFQAAQIAPSLVVKELGNSYAASSLLSLIAVLDQAQAGQKILLASYGSGAGSDAFLFETTKNLVKERQKWRALLKEKIEKLEAIDFAQFLRIAEGRIH